MAYTWRLTYGYSLEIGIQSHRPFWIPTFVGMTVLIGDGLGLERDGGSFRVAGFSTG